MLHFIVIPKPLLLADPGALYLMGWSLLGLAAAALALRPAHWRGGARYTLTEIRAEGAFHSLWLKPLGRALRPAPGQFVTLRGKTPGLADWHPFTVSGHKAGALRITIANRGAWTQNLVTTAKPGDEFHLRGPHGRFIRPEGANRQVWLSAGIGITPHIAWASAAATPTSPVDIIHICRSRGDVPHLASLEGFSQSHSNVTLKVYETSQRRRPDARDLLRLIRDRDERVDVFFCGPEGLKQALEQAKTEAQKAKLEIFSEAFEFRSDLPLPKWWVRVWSEIKGAVIESWQARRQ